jgi:hypothetical protein
MFLEGATLHGALAMAGSMPPQQPAPSSQHLHRLKINGLPPNTYTDARLRQLFSCSGQVRERLPTAPRQRSRRLLGQHAAIRAAATPGFCPLELANALVCTQAGGRLHELPADSCAPSRAPFRQVHAGPLCEPLPRSLPRHPCLNANKQVVEARIVYDRDSGRAAGYAYVSYATKAEAGARWGRALQDGRWRPRRQQGCCPQQPGGAAAASGSDSRGPADSCSSGGAGVRIAGGTSKGSLRRPTHRPGPAPVRLRPLISRSRSCSRPAPALPFPVPRQTLRLRRLMARSSCNPGGSL